MHFIYFNFSAIAHSLMFFRTLKAQFENYKQQIKKASENAKLEAKQSPDAARDVGQVCSKEKHILTKGLVIKVIISKAIQYNILYCWSMKDIESGKIHWNWTMMFCCAVTNSVY